MELFKKIQIALAGNQNAGKTSFFNDLTGKKEFVGNWPGVTVAKSQGRSKDYDNIIITDLPGVYSLSPYTSEEIVTRNYILSGEPMGILNVVDASNIERNLYLTTQLMEVGLPVVIALNMIDVIKKRGDKIDIKKLSMMLHAPIVETSALTGEGIEDALKAILQEIEERTGNSSDPHMIFGEKEETEDVCHISFLPDVEAAIKEVTHLLPNKLPNMEAKRSQALKRWYAIKVLEGDKSVSDLIKLDEKKSAIVTKLRSHLEETYDDEIEAIIIDQRYDYVTNIISHCVTKKNEARLSVSDRVDSILTNRYLALPIFALIIFFIYFIAVSGLGGLVTNWANEGLFGEGWQLFGHNIKGIPVAVGEALDYVGASPILKSLIVEGMLGGVGAVLGFVPELFILFFLLSFLEETGYMARIAFILDRVFRKFALSGKSFIPILVGSGCGVPGIMASRTIENEADRRMTILTTTFIPCSAKVPLIALIAGAIFGGNILITISAYFLGVLSILISGLILKKSSLFNLTSTPFIMELPEYHFPHLSSVMKATCDRSAAFIKKAFTVILLASIIVWLLSNYGVVNGKLTYLHDKDLSFSFLSYIGRLLTPLFYPIGCGNYQMVVSSLTGLVAKENLVSTLGILYDKQGSTLYEAIAAHFTPISALSFLTFNLLCAPCIAAMSAIKKEMNSNKWFIFAITYQCLYAYVISFIVYHLGSFLTGHFIPSVLNIVFLTVSFLLLFLLIYFIARKKKENKNK